MAKANQKRDLARILYFDSDFSQKEIAEHVGTTEQTVSKWANEGKWREQKAVETLSPDKLVREYYYQSDVITNAAREDKRPLTASEADALVKLASAIDKLDRKISPSVTMSVLMRFNHHLKIVAPELVPQIVKHEMDYVNTLIKPEK